MEKFGERQALKEYISFIRDERRKLSDEYWKSIERLRQLDEVERVEQGESNDLAQQLLNVVKEQGEAIERFSKLLTNGGLNNCNCEGKITEIYEEKTVTTKKRYTNIEIYAKHVCNFLKGKGAPATAAEIKDYLDENMGFEISNVYDKLNRILDNNLGVRRVGRGLYQYFIK